MKLNNKGWGLKEMVIVSILLFLCLFIASYYIYVLYNRLTSNDYSQYFNLEHKLKNAAANYIIDYSIDLDDKASISLSEIRKKRYLISFEDEDGNDCSGYVIIDYGSIKPYIKCNNYTTEDYQSIYDK